MARLVRVRKDRFVIFCMLGNYWFARKEWREKEPVRGGGGRWTNKNWTKLGGGRGRVKTDEKNQQNWEVGERMKKTRGGGRRTKINRTRLPTAPLGVEIVCENNMRRRLSERIPLKKT